jgi:hypothetical protein
MKLLDRREWAASATVAKPQSFQWFRLAIGRLQMSAVVSFNCGGIIKKI